MGTKKPRLVNQVNQAGRVDSAPSGHKKARTRRAGFSRGGEGYSANSVTNQSTSDIVIAVKNTKQKTSRNLRVYL